MAELWIAFITGLTTGGLSCLAVQGGLLASSLAHQIEADLSTNIQGQKSNPKIALPIILFLAAKLAAYTGLGFFLGWVGSVLQLTPITRAVLQIGIGIFMVGQALRIFKVHPVFRYFNIEPPVFITRYIRRKSQNTGSFFSPVFLGALTVLIPCGITQAIMAAAMATGNPVTGAAMMFAFILGTSPVFFSVAYFATKLGSTMEKYFMKFVGAAVLILGLITINTGLNLMGSPLSLNNLTGRIFDVQAAGIFPGSGASQVFTGKAGGQKPSSERKSASCCSGVQAGLGASAGLAQATPGLAGGCPMMRGGKLNTGVLPDQSTGPQTGEQPSLTAAPLGDETRPQQSPTEGSITIHVTNDGYVPNQVHAQAGIPIKLQMVSDNVYSCALAFVIPGINYQKVLPPSGTTVIDIPAQNKGTSLYFSCSMGMYTGEIVFDQ